MKAAVKLLVSLLPLIISSDAIDKAIDAALFFVKQQLGDDSLAYDVLSRVVEHCRQNGCLKELGDILTEILSDRFGAVGYTVTIDDPRLSQISGDLATIRQQCL